MRLTGVCGLAASAGVWLREIIITIIIIQII